MSGLVDEAGRRNGRVDLGTAVSPDISADVAGFANATDAARQQSPGEFAAGLRARREGQAVAARSYVTPSALLRLDERLSDRDRDIVRAVAECTILSGSQLRRLFFPEAGQGRGDGQLARRSLLRLARYGLLVRLERRIGGLKGGSDGFCYRLGAAGQRLIRFWDGEGMTRGRQLPEPGERFVQHRLAVSELYVGLRVAEADGLLELAFFESEPRSWRRYVGPLGGNLTLKPDAFARVAVADVELWWFIEVDLGTVGQAARGAQAAAYRTYWRSGAAGDVMPRVLWLGPDDPTLARVVAAIRPISEPAGLFVPAISSAAVERLCGHRLDDSAASVGSEVRT